MLTVDRYDLPMLLAITLVLISPLDSTRILDSEKGINAKEIEVIDEDSDSFGFAQLTADEFSRIEAVQAKLENEQALLTKQQNAVTKPDLPLRILSAAEIEPHSRIDQPSINPLKLNELVVESSSNIMMSQPVASSVTEVETLRQTVNTTTELQEMIERVVARTIWPRDRASQQGVLEGLEQCDDIRIVEIPKLGSLQQVKLIEELARLRYPYESDLVRQIPAVVDANSRRAMLNTTRDQSNIRVLFFSEKLDQNLSYQIEHLIQSSQLTSEELVGEYAMNAGRLVITISQTNAKGVRNVVGSVPIPHCG